MSAAPVIPPRTFRRNLRGYIRSAKAGHEVVIGASAPEVRLVRATAEGPSSGDVHVSPGLFADLIVSGAEAAASRLAEAQCSGGDIEAALKLGLGDNVIKLLKTDNGVVWAGLYFRALITALHRFENATALPIISLAALLAHLSLSLENDRTTPSGRWQQLRATILAGSQTSTPPSKQELKGDRAPSSPVWQATKHLSHRRVSP